MRVSDILRHKGTDVATVPPSTTIEEAVAELGRRSIGALVVTGDGEGIDGIVSERDIIRRVAEVGRDALDAEVTTIMTHDVATCAPDDAIEELMTTMTNRRFRHVPVLVDGRLGGIVSIGDIVARRLAELETESALMHDYIQTGRG